MGHKAPSLDTALTILFATGACGLGSGTLAYSGSALTYTAPGDTAGEAVTIADGETAVIYSGTVTKYLVVARSGDWSDGSALVTTDGYKAPQEELLEIQAAISKVLTAISAQQGDERIQYETLKNLQMRENTITKRIAALGGDPSAAVVSSPDWSQT